MPLPTEIQNALIDYDHNKGFFRRLFGDQAAIRKLRKLSDTDQTNFLKLYRCFIENLPKPIQASYRVYQALISFLDNLEFNGVHQAMDQLYKAKLITSENLEKLIKLKASHFQLLANLLTQLDTNHLLNDANFDTISKLFETSEENIPAEFNCFAKAVDILNNNDCLNQSHFDYILERPNYAVNIAVILVILSETNLLTPTNLNLLKDPNNQFLISDDANSILWTHFKNYLNRLLIDKTNQSIFDSILQLAKQENPKTEIQHYMNQLNSQADMYRKIFPFKPSSTPRKSSKEHLLDPEELHASLNKSGTM